MKGPRSPRDCGIARPNMGGIPDDPVAPPLASSPVSPTRATRAWASPSSGSATGPPAGFEIGEPFGDERLARQLPIPRHASNDEPPDVDLLARRSSS
jgi:hypothetical protein